MTNHFLKSTKYKRKFGFFAFLEFFGIHKCPQLFPNNSILDLDNETQNKLREINKPSVQQTLTKFTFLHTRSIPKINYFILEVCSLNLLVTHIPPFDQFRKTSFKQLWTICKFFIFLICDVNGIKVVKWNCEYGSAITYGGLNSNAFDPLKFISS